MASIPIKIGKDVFSKEEVTFKLRYYGNIVVVAPPRYGKSFLIDLALDQIANKTNRAMLIVDDTGEHRSLKQSSIFDDEMYGIPELQIMKNIAFKISDFTSPDDWTSLGFSPGAVYKLAQLAQRIELHEDRPMKFLRLLYNVPAVTSNMKNINPNDTTFYTSTKQAAITNFENLLPFKAQGQYKDYGFFATDELIRKGIYKYTGHFGELMLNNYRILWDVQLNAKNIKKQRAICGKLLEHLGEGRGKYLNRIKPVLFFEEADKFFPNEDEESYYISQTNRVIKEIVLKQQKYGVVAFFVLQDARLFFPPIYRNAHTKILGKLDEGMPDWKETEDLRWDFDKNYRQFKIISKDSIPSKQTFVPLKIRNIIPQTAYTY